MMGNYHRQNQSLQNRYHYHILLASSTCWHDDTTQSHRRAYLNYMSERAGRQNEIINE
jgi:hypothetical protein